MGWSLADLLAWLPTILVMLLGLLNLSITAWPNFRQQSWYILATAAVIAALLQRNIIYQWLTPPWILVHLALSFIALSVMTDQQGQD